MGIGFFKTRNWELFQLCKVGNSPTYIVGLSLVKERFYNLPIKYHWFTNWLTFPESFAACLKQVVALAFSPFSE